jgi:undecaprenyl-phosphate 4-deoxy-4-formamido-L-arabinose transferase
VPFEIIRLRRQSDDSWDRITRLTEQWPEVRGIRLTRNYGPAQRAILCGVRAAKHAVIVTIDDDLQHPPEEVPAPCSIGWRRARPRLQDAGGGAARVDARLPASRRPIKLAHEQVLGVDAARDVSAFSRLRNLPCGRRSPPPQQPHVMIGVLLSWATVRLRFGQSSAHEERKRSGCGIHLPPPDPAT